MVKYPRPESTHVEAELRRLGQNGHNGIVDKNPGCVGTINAGKELRANNVDQKVGSFNEEKTRSSDLVEEQRLVGSTNVDKELTGVGSTNGRIGSNNEGDTGGFGSNCVEEDLERKLADSLSTSKLLGTIGKGNNIIVLDPEVLLLL